MCNLSGSLSQRFCPYPITPAASPPVLEICTSPLLVPSHVPSQTPLFHCLSISSCGCATPYLHSAQAPRCTGIFQFVCSHCSDCTMLHSLFPPQHCHDQITSTQTRTVKTISVSPIASLCSYHLSLSPSLTFCNSSC